MPRLQSPFTVIYSHGNAEDLGLNFENLMAMANELRCDMFAYEYPGYGCSDPDRSRYLAGGGVGSQPWLLPPPPALYSWVDWAGFLIDRSLVEVNPVLPQ
jgi:pimeloyl-ACP methyl ester carboxylesterase